MAVTSGRAGEEVAQADQCSRLPQGNGEEGDPFEARLYPTVAPIPFVEAIDAATEDEAEALGRGQIDVVIDGDRACPGGEGCAGFEGVGNIGFEALGKEPAAELVGVLETGRDRSLGCVQFNAETAFLVVTEHWGVGGEGWGS